MEHHPITTKHRRINLINDPQIAGVKIHKWITFFETCYFLIEKANNTQHKNFSKRVAISDLHNNRCSLQFNLNISRLCTRELINSDYPLGLSTCNLQTYMYPSAMK